MFNSFARGVVRGALTLAVMAPISVFGASAAQAAAPRLALTALSFENSVVDTTQPGFSANKLTWTVTNTDPDAFSVGGTVTMRMRSTVTGALLGHDRVARWEYGQTCCDAVFESGTPQESTYSYYLPVRRYADAGTAVWEVTNVTVYAGEQTASISRARLRAFPGYSFTAYTQVDSSGPTIDSISLWEHEPYVFLNGEPAPIPYSFTVQDGESGFWRGTIKLAGPGGQKASTAFTWERDEYSTGTRCGSVGSGDMDGFYMSCAISVDLPADAAPGNWRIASLVLENNAGGRTTYKNPTAPSVTATANTTVQASGFLASPNPVDNWRDDVMGEVSMVVTGARRGISSVRLTLTWGCDQWGSVTVRPDGRLAVPVRISRGDDGCEVSGAVVVDGAGNAALYGPAYGAPAVEAAFTQIPSTEPPTALGATLDPPTLPLAEVYNRSIALTIQAAVGVAPIDGVSVQIYNAAGQVVYQSFGGTSQLPDGTVTHYIYLGGYLQEPGEYRVGFGLTDAARNESYYDMPDYPNSQPIPGGPVILTITEE